jgi:hypothetical protein
MQELCFQAFIHSELDGDHRHDGDEARGQRAIERTGTFLTEDAQEAIGDAFIGGGGGRGKYTGCSCSCSCSCGCRSGGCSLYSDTTRIMVGGHTSLRKAVDNVP